MISYFYNEILNVLFGNFNDIKAFLYVCDMLQKTFVESLFGIPIKTFLIEVLSWKAFWLEALLQKAVPNWPIVFVSASQQLVE